MEQLHDNALTFYVIYSNPADYPGEVVCRRQFSARAGILKDPDLYLRGRRVEDVRADLLTLHPGLVLSPVIEPDPVIAEVWL